MSASSLTIMNPSAGQATMTSMVRLLTTATRRGEPPPGRQLSDQAFRSDAARRGTWRM
jgi:hypothetical protein